VSHEFDAFWCNPSRGHHQIAFILAILIVHIANHVSARGF
jgi:hypothetical protein